MDREEHPWWQKTTVYQVYPRSFFDSNGDGIGDLQGVIQKLDYLQWLGVETLWLTPFFDSPDRDFGYDIRDYRKVSDNMGTWPDFLALLFEVKKRGLRLVLDLVLNHTSDEHPWFQQALKDPKSEKRGYYLFAPGRGRGKPPNNWRSMIGPSGWQDAGAGDYYFTSFLPFQPDLNLRNPAVWNEWQRLLTEFLTLGVDGLRLDIFNALFKDPLFADNPFSFRPLPSEDNPDGFFQRNLHTINHPDSIEFARTLRAFVDSVPGGPRLLVGEVFGPPSLLKKYCGAGEGLHLVFLFKTLGTDFSAESFYRLLDEYERDFAPPLQPTWVLGNHDRTRYLFRLGNDVRKAKVLSTLQLTARGVPFLYQGEEIGMTQIEIPLAQALDPLAHRYRFVPPWLARWLRRRGVLINRDECRTPFQWSAQQNAGFSPPGVKPWLPIHPDYPQTNLEAQMHDPQSLLHHVRNLLGLRKQWSALCSGTCSLWAKTRLPPGVLGYRRASGQQSVDVLLNFSEQTRPIQTPGPLIYSSHRQPSNQPKTRLHPFESALFAQGSPNGPHPP